MQKIPQDSKLDLHLGFGQAEEIDIDPLLPQCSLDRTLLMLAYKYNVIPLSWVVCENDTRQTNAYQSIMLDAILFCEGLSAVRITTKKLDCLSHPLPYSLPEHGATEYATSIC